jgi:hypothetical protein
MKSKSNSCVEKTSAPRGTTIVRTFGRDNSGHDVPNSRGKELGGGVDNLSHSLSGASAVQRGK